MEPDIPGFINPATVDDNVLVSGINETLRLQSVGLLTNQVIGDAIFRFRIGCKQIKVS